MCKEETLKSPILKKDKPYLPGNFQHDNKGALQCYTVFYMQSFVNCSLKTIKLENCSISKHAGCGIFAFK